MVKRARPAGKCRPPHELFGTHERTNARPDTCACPPVRLAPTLRIDPCTAMSTVLRAPFGVVPASQRGRTGGPTPARAPARLYAPPHRDATRVTRADPRTTSSPLACMQS